MELCKACVLLDTLHQKRAKKELEMEEEGDQEGKMIVEEKEKGEGGGCGREEGEEEGGCGGESRICGCSGKGGKGKEGEGGKELLASFNELVGGLLQEGNKT